MGSQREKCEKLEEILLNYDRELTDLNSKWALVSAGQPEAMDLMEKLRLIKDKLLKKSGDFLHEFDTLEYHRSKIGVKFIEVRGRLLNYLDKFKAKTVTGGKIPSAYANRRQSVSNTVHKYPPQSPENTNFYSSWGYRP